MSFEKVKVKRVYSEANRDTGEILNYLEFEILTVGRIRFNDATVKLMPTYETLVGKEALIPMQEGTYEGRKFFRFIGDAQPIPVPDNKPSTSSIFGKTGTAG